MSDPAPHPNPTQVWFLIVDHKNIIFGGMGLGFVKVPTDSRIGKVTAAIVQKAQLTVPDHLLEVYVFSGDLDVDDAKRQEQIKKFFRNKPDEKGEKRKLSGIKYSEENDVVVVRLPEELEKRDKVYNLATVRMNYASQVLKSRELSINDPGHIESINQYIRHGRFSKLAGPHDKPVSLYHPALASFWHECSILEEHPKQVNVNPAYTQSIFSLETTSTAPETVSVSYDDDRVFREFIEKSGQSYKSEKLRWKNAVKPFLVHVLGESECKVESCSDSDTSVKRGVDRADATWSTKYGPYVVVEIKNERRIGGDAMLQGAYWYLKYISKKEEEEEEEPREYMSPAIIIAIMGTIIEISLAIFIDEVIVDTIFQMNMLKGHYLNSTIAKLASLSVELAKCAKSLREEHRKIRENGERSLMKEQGRIGRFLPFPSKLPSVDQPDLKLVFKWRIDRYNNVVGYDDEDIATKVFLADYIYTNEQGIEETKEVLVKLAASYNIQAHKMLADKGYAPKLYTSQPVIGNYLMVVMERLKGETLKSFNGRKIWTTTVLDDVEKAVDILHENNIVFGDLRDQNVIVLSDGDPKRAKLIDFDWAGEVGKATYPESLNKDLISGVDPELSPDVTRSGLITKEHDLYALAHLREAYERERED